VQYVIWLVGYEEWTCYTDAACVAIVVAMCLQRDTNRRWIKEWYKGSRGYKQENLMTDLMLSDPKDSLPLVHQLMGYSRLLPLKKLKKY
jgi:hypothetical protein